MPTEHYFMKVTNHSENRDVEVTHAWFATNPPVHILASTRPLPVRLRPDKTFEMWVPVDMLGGTAHAERLGRVRLPNGSVVKSRLNKARAARRDGRGVNERRSAGRVASCSRQSASPPAQVWTMAFVLRTARIALSPWRHIGRAVAVPA